MIPYFRERISEQHSGFVCVFTEAFFSRFGNIRDYPVFHNTSAAVIPLSPGEVPNKFRQAEGNQGVEVQ